MFDPRASEWLLVGPDISHRTYLPPRPVTRSHLTSLPVVIARCRQIRYVFLVRDNISRSPGDGAPLQPPLLVRPITHLRTTTAADGWRAVSTSEMCVCPPPSRFSHGPHATSRLLSTIDVRLTLALIVVPPLSRITLHSYEAFVDQVGVRTRSYSAGLWKLTMLQWVFTTGLSLSTTVDVLITVSLIVLLQRSRTGFSTVSVLSSLRFRVSCR